MSTDELHLDEQTLARAKRLAAENGISVEELVSKAIDRFTPTPSEKPASPDSVIGLFSDVPELMDEIVEEAYRNRESRPFRLKPE
jgi:hypothetical protein